MLTQNNMPKLSIITINFNDKNGLKKTLESVAAQSYKGFEYIVVDGGSSDGSIDVINEYSPYISKWISEPDKGIYDAMNKGTRMATGEHCLFLNSGDRLHDENAIKLAYETINDKDIYFGGICNIWNNGKTQKTSIWKLSRDITLQTIYEGAIPHAGSFIRRSLMLKYPYRDDLRICSDRQFFIQAIILDNCSYSALDHIVCDFDMSGISSTQDTLLYDENIKILNDLLPKRIVSDYLKTNLTLQDLTSRLVPYRKCLTNLVCGVDDLIIKSYETIRKLNKRK